jgi:hypothetical protein
MIGANRGGGKVFGAEYYPEIGKTIVRRGSKSWSEKNYTYLIQKFTRET